MADLINLDQGIEVNIDEADDEEAKEMKRRAINGGSGVKN